jgi:hypothetical protein
VCFVVDLEGKPSRVLPWIDGTFRFLHDQRKREKPQPQPPPAKRGRRCKLAWYEALHIPTVRASIRKVVAEAWPEIRKQRNAELRRNVLQKAVAPFKIAVPHDLVLSPSMDPRAVADRLLLAKLRISKRTLDSLGPQ